MSTSYQYRTWNYYSSSLKRNRMHQLSVYLLQSVLCSALFLAYYWCVLRNRRMHMFNRFYLLATVACSIVIPLLHFEIPVNAAVETAYYPLRAIMHSSGTDEPETTAVTTHMFRPGRLLIAAYIAVAAIFLLIQVWKIVRIIQLRSCHETELHKGYRLILTTTTGAPFSFFSWLFWHADTDRDTPEGQRILAHERTHIRQHHSLDKLLVSLILAVFWINPFFWLLRRELALVHEYLADEAAIGDRDTAAFARMLLHSAYKGRFAGITSPFFCSPIKNRLLMLQQTKLPKGKLFRALAVTPLLVGTLCLCSFRISHQQTVVAKTKLTIALDAGHGGTDAGASGTGASEKELNLKITRRLARLAPEYNISVVSVRPDDANVTLKDRAAKANASGASVFVSIHMNSTPENQAEQHAGFDLMIDAGNARIDQSRALASGIAYSLDKDVHIATRTMDKRLAVLHDVQVPAVLIECGYMKQAADEARVNDPAQLDALCRSILSGIVQYHNKQ